MIGEHELLEQIADDERDFAFALRIYGGDLTRLKRVLLYQISDDLIEIRRVGEARILMVSELKVVLCDDANFLDASQASNYAIRLTNKGQRCAFS